MTGLDPEGPRVAPQAYVQAGTAIQQPFTDQQILLILVGLPGSGKTTLAEALVQSSALAASGERSLHRSRPWVRASQDDAPNRRRQECEAVVSQALTQGCNVVVDRVGFDPVQRSHFIRLAHSLPLAVPPTIYALTLYVSPASLSSRLAARPSHPTLTTPDIAQQVLRQMMREWDPPRPGRKEGFDRVLEMQEGDQPAGGVWTGQGVRKLLADFQRWGHEEIGQEWRPRTRPAPAAPAGGARDSTPIDESARRPLELL